MPYDANGKKKKRKLNKFTLKEVSIVGKPAQEPALIAISKSAAEDIQMTEAEIQKQQEELKKAQEQNKLLETTVAEQTAKIEKMAKMNALTADVRVYYDGLSEGEQTSFLEKSATLQEAEVQNAKLANAVIYKDRNSVEYRKDDDPRIVQLAKDADEQAAQIKKMQEQNETLQLQKMADDFKFLPGDDNARLALVKAVSSIESEELKKSAFEILKSKNAGNSGMFKTNGTSTQTLEEMQKSGQSSIEEMVEKHQKDNPGTLLEKSWDAVLQTPEGAQAYEQYEQGRMGIGVQ